MELDRSKLKSDPREIEAMLKSHQETLRVVREKMENVDKALEKVRASRRELREAGYLR